MSPASRVKRAVAKAIYTNYGRHAPYLRQLERLNRMPLLSSLAKESRRTPSFPTREAMWDFLCDRARPRIDYLEFGVHRGHSILHWAARNRDPESRFYGFDTFTGLPERWSSLYPEGHFDTGGRPPDTADARVAFVKGLFQDTLPAFLERWRPEGALVVHNDCDLYSSTLFCLTTLDRILEPGSLIVFDEFGDVLHEFRAFQDYVAGYRRQFRVVCSHDDFFTVAVEML
jgi:O-methyltransferase